MNTDPIPSMRRRLDTQSNERCRQTIANYMLWSTLRVLIRDREGAREVHDERIDFLLGVKPEGLAGRVRIEAWSSDARVVGIIGEIAEILAERAESPLRLAELLANSLVRARGTACARPGNFIPYRIELSASHAEGGSVRCLLDEPWRPEGSAPFQFRTSELLVLLGRAANGSGSQVSVPSIARLNHGDRKVLQWGALVARGWSPRIVFECISIEAGDHEEWRMSGVDMKFI
ncbi:MAG: hypothetical protein ACKO3W_02375 [bacterium]